MWPSFPSAGCSTPGSAEVSETVALAPATDITPDGLRPVVVSVAERQKRTIELGASYDTTDGVGLDAKWTRYSMLGRADTASILGRLSKIDSRIQMVRSLPHWESPRQTSDALRGGLRQPDPAYDSHGVTVSADVIHRWGATPPSAWSVPTSPLGVAGPQPHERGQDRHAHAAGARYLRRSRGLADMALDRSDDPLDPKRGWRVGARVEPTLLTGDGTLPYLKLQSQVSGYLPFDEKGRTVLKARLHLGSILNGTVSEIPATLRFWMPAAWAPCAASLPGGRRPVCQDNTLEGGLSLAEASVELRREVTERWGVVLFVDTGAVGEGQVPGFGDMSVGAGVGVRYNLGFGLLRVDVATR